ncbi:MAG: hypothetical protein LBC31_08045 [Treponema sp.]|nr:hypothetical protein [Treponema sp.]
MKAAVPALLILLAAGGTVFAEGPVLSGNIETTVFAASGAGTSPDFFYGAEEYANLRLKVPAGECAAVYGAFNLIAAAGGPAAAALGTGSAAAPGAGNAAGSGFSSFTAGENFAAAIELERLYLQLSGDTLGLSTGLLRIPLGYSLAWGPIDFLNPRNPLITNARLRAVLGLLGSWYPLEDMKFFGFAAAPEDPLAADGGGSRFGLGWENHWPAASLQLLASYESPAAYTASLPVPASVDYPFGLYRFGFSLKAELEIGFAAEALYTLNRDSPAFSQGLSAAAGFDYSFFDGKLYVLVEYLYSGTESVSAAGPANLQGRQNNHYLYGAFTWLWNDYTSITLGSGVCLDDPSAIPSLKWEHEIFQGTTLSLEARVPLDGESFGNGNAGEFGPEASGSLFSFTGGLRVKF